MNYTHILQDIQQEARYCGRDPKEITLVVVSKNRPWSDSQPIYNEGQRDFGENRVKDLLDKSEEAPRDVHWHLIGTLQKNKIPKIMGKTVLIHSVDTFELAQKISDSSRGRMTNILLQVNTSGEESKQGLSIDEWRPLIPKVLKLPNIKVEGLMTMAPLTEDQEVVRNTFRQLRLFRDELKLKHLSMGMSHDYKIAIQEGATILRIGTAVYAAIPAS